MAHEDDPEQPGDARRDQSNPQLPALEARVARLELDLAALQRQIAAQPVSLPAAAPVAPAAPAAPRPVAGTKATPPPPLPSLPRPDATATGAQRNFPETWGSASSRTAKVQVPGSRDSFESRLGSQIFNRIAIVLLLIGTAYFLKLAIDRQWIGPTGQVLAVLIGGASLVVWSERFRRKGFAAFSYSLKAVGSGVLYLALWAAFQHFHLIPASAALALMVLVTAWNAYMAWAQDSELLAAYALAGGFATPLLLSTGGKHEIFLLTYLLAIDLAILALVRLKAWPRLLLGAFPLTVAFFSGWYGEFYTPGDLAPTSVFIVLFAVAFASVPLARASGRGTARSTASAVPRMLPLATLLEDILLPLANAASTALAFYRVLEDSGHHALLPWLMIVLAAAYLGLMQLPQARTASAIHLSLAVVLLTIAIPLKASGHWITVSWLVEGLALLWVATRLAASGPGSSPEADAAGAHASRVLRPLAMTSLGLGFCGICTHSIGLADLIELPLLNKGTGTALTGIAVFAVAAWLALRAAATSQVGVAEERTFGWSRIAIAAFILIDLTAVLLTLRELLLSWRWVAGHPPFQTADFATALIGLAVFACVVAVSLRLAGAHPGERFWMNCAALSTIAFNLIAVLTGVREIEAIWDSYLTPEAALQQALAISAFLMLYGAALLAAGFWKRSGFLRWQALLLLVVSIFKTFLYDMRSLSQGYRVVSFLGLGALLMAISFAYQKDWLALRPTEAAGSPNPDPAADSAPDSGAAG